MIRKINLRDAAELLNLYAGDNPRRLAITAHTENLTGYWQDGILLAAWTYWVGDLHPEVASFTVITNPMIVDYTMLGPIIMGAIERHTRRLRGLRFVDVLPHSSFGRWLRGQGFQMVSQSTETRLNLRTLHVVTPPVPATGQILLARDLLVREQLAVKFTRLTYDQYAHSHRENPVLPFEEDDWTERLMNRLVGKAPMAYVVGDEIRAYCLLRRAHPGEYELAWSWGRDRADMRVLLPHVMSFVKASGTTLKARFSSRAPYDRFVWEQLPFEAAPATANLIRLSNEYDDYEVKTGDH